MNISYHAWKDYQECPKKYFLRYRKDMKPPAPENEYHTLYGRLTEKFFEIFCNTWRYTMAYMPPEEIKFKLSKLWDDILSVSYVVWNSGFAKDTKEDIFAQSLSDVTNIMSSMNQNYFLNTRSEVSVELKIKDGVNITGRIDFIHKRPMSQGVVIFDGKGTNKLGKNISNDQVLFYALLYYFHFKVLPEELGFFYYRFNTFQPVEISLPILNQFRARLSLDIKKITTDASFTATPCYKACKYCVYQTVCKECMDDRATRKRGSILKDMPEDIGVINLSL